MAIEITRKNVGIVCISGRGLSRGVKARKPMSIFDGAPNSDCKFFSLLRLSDYIVGITTEPGFCRWYGFYDERTRFWEGEGRNERVCWKEMG